MSLKRQLTSDAFHTICIYSLLVKVLPHWDNGAWLPSIVFTLLTTIYCHTLLKYNNLSYYQVVSAD